MDYQVRTFSELTTKEFYELVKLRIAVFVVEQTCFYQEVDEVDEVAIHTWLQDGETIVGYTRIYRNLAGEVMFGRVLIAPEYRGKKLGNRLIEETLKVTKEVFPDEPIIIGAQAHLVDFYGAFGFESISERYLEDDIPHIRMKKAPN